MSIIEFDKDYDYSSIIRDEFLYTGISQIAAGSKLVAIQPLPANPEFVDSETFRLVKFASNSTSFLDVTILNGFSSSEHRLLKRALEEYAALSRWELYLPYLRGRLADPLIEPRDNALAFPHEGGRHAHFSPNLEEPTKVHICLALSWSATQGASQTLIIEPFEEEPDADGTWTAGLANVNNFDTNLSLKIKINETFLNSDRPGYPGQNYRFWSGVIAHEIMHNLGWTHNSTPYNRTFITAMTTFFSSATNFASMFENVRL